jgi:hypothetical protein
MAKISKELWITRVKEAAEHYKIPVMSLTKTKFEKFMYREAAERAADSFNSWEELLRIASLKEDDIFLDEPTPRQDNKKSKIITEAYKSPFDFDFSKYKDITHPSDFKPAQIYEFNVNPGDLIVAIPDLHFPFVHTKALVYYMQIIAELYEQCQLDKVTLHIVQLGDLYDLYGFSRYEKTHSLNPKKEIEIAMEMAKKFWDSLPKGNGVKRYQLAGNHDIRTQKYILSKAPDLRDFIPSAKELLAFDDVFSMDNDKDCILFKTPYDKVIGTHGYLSDSISHAKKFKCSVFHGHAHSAGIAYIALDNGLVFSMNCGFIGDAKTFALAYSSTAHSKDWVLNLSTIKVSKKGKFMPMLNAYTEGE